MNDTFVFEVFCDELWVFISLQAVRLNYPDREFRGANMGPIWGRQDPGGPHVGPMNFAIWVCMYFMCNSV